MTIAIDKKSIPTAKTLEEPIKLEHNENPLGPSPLAIEAARQALLNCHRYPCSKGLALKNRLASHLSNIAPNHHPR